MTVELHMLGPLEAVRDGGVLALGGPKQRAVLARLALSSGRGVSSDALIDALWGDEVPETAAATLSAYVSRLRKVLGSDAIGRGPNGYVLDPSIGRDVDRFERLLAGDRDSSALKAAVDLWRGPFLGDLGDEPWARPEAVRLAEMRLLAVEDRFARLLDEGADAGLVPEIELELARAPLRERLWESLMLALYRAGRQADALRAYGRAAAVLGEELGIEPGDRLRRLEESILLQHPTLRVDGAVGETVAVRNNLPDRPRGFVGREVELDEIGMRLTAGVLVTIAGAGGVGKTTMAVELAHRVAPAFPGGAWWIDLAPLMSGDQVREAFLDALDLGPRPGQDPLDIVADAVGDRPTLFVIDNCEHVLATAQDAATILGERCPGSGILTTSREAMLLPGEHVVPLGPLPLPTTLQGAADNPAVRLFTRRAQATSPGFQLSSVTLPLVVEVVKRLDGIPLAIEIAASQMPMLSLRDIADGLGGRFVSLEAPGRAPRHATMTAALDWSWQLLDPGPRETLAHLGAFAGAFTVEAAGMAVGREVQSDIEELARVSLVEGPVVDSTGRHRYRLLEPTKQFARSHVPAGIDPDLAHASAYLSLAAVGDRALHSPDQVGIFKRLAADHAELTKAVAVARGRPDGGELLADLAGALWYWLTQSGHAVLAGQILTDALSVEHLPSSRRLRLLAASALVGSESSDDDIVERANEALIGARELEPADVAWVSLIAGDALTAVGEYAASEAPLLHAVEYYESQGIDWGAGWAHLRLCRTYGLTGDFATADTHLMAAETRLMAAGDLQLLAYCRLVRGNRERLTGAFESSLVFIRDARDRFVSIGQELVADECRFLEARALIDVGRWEGAIAVAEDLRTRAAREARLSSIAGAQLLIIQAFTKAGNIDEARLAAVSFERDAPAMGVDYLIPHVAVELVSLALLMEDLDAARDALAHAAALEQSQNPWTKGSVLLARARVALAGGDPEAAASEASAVLGLLPAERHPHAAVAAHAIRGLTGHAVDSLEEIERIIDGFEPGLDALTLAQIDRLRALA